MTWPLSMNLTSLLGAPTGPGDPYLNLWILGWGMRAWLDSPASVLAGRVFDANIFHPAAGTLAYSDHLLLQSAALSPLYAVSGDVVLCYNVLLLASLVASALAMHLFIARVIGSRGGAYLAGLAWGFGSYRFAHLLHLQLQALYFLPLTFLFLHRLIAGRRRRDALVLGVLTALQAIASVYYAVIGGLALVVGGAVLAAMASRRGASTVAARLALAAIVAAVLVLPVGLVYWRVQQDEGFGRNLFEASRNAAFADSYLQAPPGNLLYGRTGVLRRAEGLDADGLPHTGPERELFPGFVLLLMAAAGAVLGWRSDARPLVAAMAALVVLGFVLSLGPDGVRALYATLHRHVFGFQAIRAAARFSVLVSFGLATLAALAWRELSAKAHRPGRAHAAVASAALALVVLESAHLPVALAEAPALQTGVGQWLRSAPGDGAVVVLPLGLDIDSTPSMVQSLEHGRPILNGYSGQRPSFYPSLADTLTTFPSPEALVALHEAGVQYIVAPAPVDRPDGEEAWPLVPRAQLPGGTIYELAWSPEVEERYARLTSVVPPLPGAIPFELGEESTYTVAWDGAGMNLAAGEIRLSVEGPPYRLVALAETAPWVARFFEARDAFVTTTDAALLPLVHERELNEGSRHVTRRYEYDAAAGVVRSGDVTLPLTAGARDAIASIFYVRTLPLATGDTVRFPVNEAGRNLIIELEVGGVEQVAVAGASRQAIRLSPRVRQRVERRAPVDATIWLSDDGRRVPVVVEVAAGFGRVRLELTNYRAGG
ncbi:MAG: DUF3108 domain-containing protein [Vicinamibacterales bacterium]